jgi:hypothetical protein
MKRLYRWSGYYVIHPISPPPGLSMAQAVPRLPSRITGREEGIGEAGWDGKHNPSILGRNKVNG